MGGFSELIKNFEKTRDFVRDFFINGFKTRGEFDKTSARTYDNEKRRVESWLGGNMRYNDSVRGRMITISVDSRRVNENPLYQAYYCKSFTDNDIRLHFFIADVLKDGGELTLKELTDILNERYDMLFDEQTVRNKLKEYTAEGMIITEKRGKTAYYSLSPDRADELLRGYPELADMVKFFSESGEFGVVGNSILRSAGLSNDLFFKKHSFIVHTLEDETIPDILRAIDGKTTIVIRQFGSKSANGYTVVPIQISASAQTGRRYLMVYDPKTERFGSFRLDKICSVKTGKPFADYDGISEKYRANLGKCWGVSFGERREEGKASPVRLRIRVGKNEGYIIERLRREKRSGTLVQLSDGLWELTLDVFDSTEPLPWIKSFIGRIASIEGGSKSMRETFLNDVERMNKMYNGE